MDFEKIKEFNVHQRDLMNKLNKKQKRKAELSIELKEVMQDIENTDNKEYKRELKAIKNEIKTASDDIRIYKDNIKNLQFIINILSYIGDDEMIVKVKNNILKDE